MIPNQPMLKALDKVQALVLTINNSLTLKVGKVQHRVPMTLSLCMLDKVQTQVLMTLIQCMLTVNRSRTTPLSPSIHTADNPHLIPPNQCMLTVDRPLAQVPMILNQCMLTVAKLQARATTPSHQCMLTAGKVAT